MDDWMQTEVVEVGDDLWETVRDTSFSVPALRLSVTVPEGYRCDLASVPRWARWLVSRRKIARAALLHDWCLDNLTEIDPDYRISRIVADAVFYDEMREDGVSAVEAAAVFVLVRLYQALYAPRRRRRP